MYFTLSQAARETGKSKGTISKYLSNGKLSYISKDEKGYKIDPAELFRVFPKNEKETDTNEQMRTPNKPQENNTLNPEVELLHERIKDKDKIIDDLREDRNDWKKQAQTLLLQSPQKPVGGKENISGEYVGKNQKKLFSGQIWAIIALFILVILLAGAGGYYYSQLKPLSPPDSIQTIPQEQKQPSATYNNPILPQSPLEYSSPVE